MPEETAVQAQAAPVEPVAAAPVTPVVIDNPVAHLDAMAEAAAVGDTATYQRLEAEYAASQTKAAEPAAEPVKEPEPEPVVAAEPVAAEQVAEIETETETEPEPGVTPVPEKDLRVRLKRDRDKAIAMLSKAENIPIEIATARYVAVNPLPGVTKVEPVAAQAPVVDTTITDLETRAEGIKTKLRAIAQDERLNDPEVEELRIELAEVVGELKAEKRAAKTLSDVHSISQAQTEVQIKQQWATLETQALAELPDLANPNSPLSLMRAGLGNAMKDPAHPDHAELFKPSAPTFLARKAAEILKIVPRGTNVPQTPAKPAVAAKEVVRPAPGSRTTAIPAGEPTPQDIIAAENAKTDAMLNGGYVPQKSGVIIL